MTSFSSRDGQARDAVKHLLFILAIVPFLLVEDGVNDPSPEGSKVTLMGTFRQ